MASSMVRMAGSSSISTTIAFSCGFESMLIFGGDDGERLADEDGFGFDEKQFIF